MTTLVLIRHGETDWNVEGRYQGQANPPLNKIGFDQAYQLVGQLKNVGLDIVYASTLLRAAQTARIIAEKLELTLYFEPRLMEIHQGEWQTRLRSEIQTLFPDIFERWESQPWQVTPPGGEHLKQVQQRVYTALDDILAAHSQETIGIVSHRIPIALIKMRYQSLDPDIVRSLKLPNTYFEIVNV